MSRKISDFFKTIPKQKKDSSSSNVNNETNCNDKENICISKSPIVKTKLNITPQSQISGGNSPSFTNTSTETYNSSIICKSPIFKGKNKPIENINKDLKDRESDDDINIKPRKRLRQISSDSDEELNNQSLKKKAKKNNIKNQVDSQFQNLKSNSDKTVSSPNSAKSILSKFHNKSLSNMEVDDSSNAVTNDDLEDDNLNNNLIHLTFNFLKPEMRRDKNGRKSDHPDYDESSIKIPEQFMDKLTPGMKQWWKIKSNGNLDKILFFKVGKFYETYHMDAVICVKELNLTYMRGNYAHSGFPEIAFTKMTDQLVLKGFKVARIEQTESVELMTERLKSTTSTTKSRVVNRELCQIVTPGTRTFSLQAETSRNRNSNIPNNDDVLAKSGVTSVSDDYRIDILMAIKEKQLLHSTSTDKQFTVEIGIAFVDSATGKFTLTQFKDDKHRSELKTVLARYTPTEILYERGNLSRASLFVLNTTLSSVHKEGLVKHKQFYSSSQTLTRLLEDDYFSDTPSSKLSPQYHLPIGLIGCLNTTNDNLGRTASDQYELSISSLGGLLYYLKQCMIDKYLVSFGEFEIFSLDHAPVHVHQKVSNDFYKSQKYMILDSMTMENLDLLRNHSTGTTEGTLLERLDFSQTAFGRRLLIQWISSPLCDPHQIKLRQDAVQDIILIDSQFSQIRAWLNSLPDLEKLLSKIHSVSVYKSIKNHPNTRAVMYENAIYSKRQISDFIAALNGFRLIQRIQSKMSKDFIQLDHSITSELIKSLILLDDDHEEENGSFPDLTEPLSFFENAFNMEIAKSEGRIIPEKGVDSEFDLAMERIAELDQEKETYLDSQRRLLKCAVNYFGTGRNALQLEIPETKASLSKLTNDYTPTSQRKGFKRYQTAETQRLLTESLSAEEQRDSALKSVQCRVFGKFDQFHQLWRKAVDNIAQLDVLQAMAVFSKGLEGCTTTRPLIEACVLHQSAHLSIDEGRYPCRAKTDNDDFIPNSVKLGDPNHSSEFKPVMLLTGPNMGGKSTLMKQVALTIVLAQMGCFVPAEGEVKFSPVDRLLTRQGANDNISLGLSTLQVELTETSHILSNMTRHSLVLIDELGRGTATHDGCALARAILYKICQSAGHAAPRTIFSTHFHRLLEEKELIDMVQIAHMACVVEDDDNDDIVNKNGGDDEDAKLQNITLLYKLTKGGCPKSYGFNAAKLANLPDKVILHGLKKARVFEEETLIKDFERVLSSSSISIVALKTFQEKLRKIL